MRSKYCPTRRSANKRDFKHFFKAIEKYGRGDIENSGDGEGVDREEEENVEYAAEKGDGQVKSTSPGVEIF
jgi:hypothetical protein